MHSVHKVLLQDFIFQNPEVTDRQTNILFNIFSLRGYIHFLYILLHVMVTNSTTGFHHNHTAKQEDVYM